MQVRGVNELRRMFLEYFERNGINIPTDTADDFEYKFEDQQGQLGSVYSRPGGLRDNLSIGGGKNSSKRKKSRSK